MCVNTAYGFFFILIKFILDVAFPNGIAGGYLFLGNMVYTVSVKSVITWELMFASNKNDLKLYHWFPQYSSRNAVKDIKVLVERMR